MLAVLVVSGRGSTGQEPEGLYAEGVAMSMFTPCQEPRTRWGVEDASLGARNHAVADSPVRGRSCTERFPQ